VNNTEKYKSSDPMTWLLSPPVTSEGGPSNYAYTGEQLFSIEREQLDKVHLAGLQKRFAELSPKVQELNKLAEENRITAINDINEVVPLLFPHTAYKSYPLSLIDECRFDLLNEWLADFTAHDLSSLDVSGCQSLDEWLNVIEANTPVRVLTSSGTSGKVSLLPRSTLENSYVQSGFSASYTAFRDEPGIADAFTPNVYHILPFARRMRNGTGLVISTLIDRFHGDESHVPTLGGEISTDVLWITGRMKKAQADGTIEQLKKTKAWQRLSGKIQELEAKKARSSEEFFKDVVTKLKDKTVVMMSGANYYSAMLESAQKYGLEVRFAPDSFLSLGGGLKGATLSDEQKEKVKKTFFPHHLNDLYGMSETLGTGTTRLCAKGHFHPPPLIVPFVLDPDTGVPYPRKGLQTGRYAVFDLWAQTYWGGFITGDEVTMNWDGNCACGRIGPYFHNDVGRYSDKRGGDDKITCQRTAAAVEEMMEHMNARNI